MTTESLTSTAVARLQPDGVTHERNVTVALPLSRVRFLQCTQLADGSSAWNTHQAPTMAAKPRMPGSSGVRSVKARPYGARRAGHQTNTNIGWRMDNPARSAARDQYDDRIDGYFAARPNSVVTKLRRFIPKTIIRGLHTRSARNFSKLTQHRQHRDRAKEGDIYLNIVQKIVNSRNMDLVYGISTARIRSGNFELFPSLAGGSHCWLSDPANGRFPKLWCMKLRSSIHKNLAAVYGAYISLDDKRHW